MSKIVVRRESPASFGFAFVRRVFGGKQVSPVMSHEEKESAARFTRGNVSIQAGVFVTEAELERQRREIALMAFPE